MGRVKKSVQEKIAEGETRTERLKVAKKYYITEEPYTPLSTSERAVYDRVIEHLNEAGAGMNIDNLLICAYCKDVLLIPMIQEQLKAAISMVGDEEAAQDAKRLNAILNGTHQRIFQNQQSLGIGALNRRKISHFTDDLESIVDKAAENDPFAKLMQ
jgi:hypothetical protein